MCLRDDSARSLNAIYYSNECRVFVVVVKLSIILLFLDTTDSFRRFDRLKNMAEYGGGVGEEEVKKVLVKRSNFNSLCMMATELAEIVDDIIDVDMKNSMDAAVNSRCVSVIIERIKQFSVYEEALNFAKTNGNESGRIMQTLMMSKFVSNISLFYLVNVESCR